jgi:hypothetical protein
MRGHNGLPPEDFKSWQDEVFPGQEEKALLIVPKQVVVNLRDQVLAKENLDFKSLKLVLIDGFLLYQNSSSRERLDVKLFFRLSAELRKKGGLQDRGMDLRRNRMRPGRQRTILRRWSGDAMWSSMILCLREEMWRERLMRVGCKRSGIKVLPELNRPIEKCLVWILQNIIPTLRSLRCS